MTTTTGNDNNNSNNNDDSDSYRNCMNEIYSIIKKYNGAIYTEEVTLYEDRAFSKLQYTIPFPKLKNKQENLK